MRIIKCSGNDPRLKEVFSLRYWVYGKELFLSDESIDHKTQLMSDEIDLISSIYIGYDKNNQIIATSRFTRLSDYSERNALPSDIRKMLMLEKFETKYSKHTVVGSKFVIKSDNRSSLLSYKMIEAAYLEGLFQDIKFVLAYCDPYLIDMYIQLGFRIFNEPLIHKDAYLTPLVLVTKDWKYLRENGSPLARAVRKNKIVMTHDESVDWFYSEFENSVEERENSLNINEISEMLFHTFGYQPGSDRAPKITEGLDKEELNKFISFSRIVKCRADELIIKTEQVTREMYIIVSGRVQITLEGDERELLIGPGQIFGETSMLINAPRLANCRAVTNCHVGIMSYQSFNQFLKAQPIIANKILLNLSKTLSFKLFLAIRGQLGVEK